MGECADQGGVINERLPHLCTLPRAVPAQCARHHSAPAHALETFQLCLGLHGYMRRIVIAQELPGDP
jgi:hypothetical protein